ncbi:MAG: hypothetical protein IT445_05795 [Phycisphaeraceae bacterium]|nr:hypothetical protein [Phycisphaeraceae bacterium]
MVTCIYCERALIKVRKGEHIVPDSLGCTLTIRNVCAKCNHEILSELDKELVSRSPLHLIAAIELDKTDSDSWDYNPDLDIALEAHPLPDASSVMLWPQILLLESGPTFFFDLEESESAGLEHFCSKFRECLTAAITSLQQDNKRKHQIIWERVRRLPRRGQFPIRIFTRHHYTDLNLKSCFICRYAGEIDQADTLRALSNWIPNTNSLCDNLGVDDPESGYSYRPRWVFRAIIKIGINILCHIYGPDKVNLNTFPEAICFVRSDAGNGPSMHDCGFVNCDDLRALACPPSCHKFRLTFDNNWGLDCAFFGGRIGATVAFPGPSLGLRTLEVTATIGSDNWQIKKSQILLPRSLRITDKLNEMIPSLPLVNDTSVIRLETERRRSS